MGIEIKYGVTSSHIPPLAGHGNGGIKNLNFKTTLSVVNIWKSAKFRLKRILIDIFISESKSEQALIQKNMNLRICLFLA